ncbi:MAG: HAD-IIA family hydrolase [Firmicutes bacterium]|nr:HAD-IIA family hydrolase [Bacillota bacterium]
MTKLQAIECFLLDMDGTIYLGDELIPGAREFITTLRERGTNYIFLTNNSSRDRSAYLSKLNKLGVPAEPRQVVTSGEATALYLDEQCPGAKVYLLGTPQLANEFSKRGFKLVTKDQSPDYVVLGFDTTLTYQKLWDACDLVRAGTPYIATHPDFNCPLPGGKYMPDTGAMIAFIEAATGKKPKVIGKPNREIVDIVLTRVTCPREQVAVVGDRLYTDIAMGQAAEITSILVLSGEATATDLSRSPHQPDFVFPSIAELAAELS